MSINGRLDANVEIYKMFVQTAENSIERRMKINQFYFSLVAALFVAYSYLANEKIQRDVLLSGALNLETLSLPMWVLPVFLLIVSMSWFSVLLSFRTLSQAKYTVIIEFEKQLSFRPFEEEWRHYKRLRKVETTHLELVIPFIFYITGVAAIVIPILPSLR